MKQLLLTLLILPTLNFNTNILDAKKSSFQGRYYDSSLKLVVPNKDNSPLFDDSQLTTYYGSFSNLVGEDLKNYLYTVISKDNHFITSYSTGVTNWYKITDRNWELSKEIDPNTYTFSQDTEDNYYLNLLYFNDNSTKSKQINTDVNSIRGKTNTDSKLTYIDWTNKKKNNINIQVDKEHVWAKSHGFSPTGDPIEGAGTDLHHLIAADHNTNVLHNNNYYGEVADDQKNAENAVYCYYADGTKSVSGYVGKEKNGNETVFEPVDLYKGDVARALLYMGTRYSKKLETNTEKEPYLLLTDDDNLTDDVKNYHGVHHNLSTFLNWNELDPVSDYEITRNNLIYFNVQNNRNPYIDYPELARRVFDKNFKLNNLDSLIKENYNLHLSSNLVLDIPDDVKVSVSFEDSGVIQFSNDFRNVTPLKEGKQIVEFKLSKQTEESTMEANIQTVFNVKKDVVLATSSNDIVISPSPFAKKYFIKLENTYASDKIFFNTDNSLFSVLPDGQIKPNNIFKQGTQVVKISYQDEYNNVKEVGTINITLKLETQDYLIYAGCVLLIVIFLVILIVILNKSKKKHIKRKRRK